MKTIELQITVQEEYHLKREIDTILRQYKQCYCGRVFTSKHKANVLNKIFKTLTGVNHPQYEKAIKQ